MTDALSERADFTVLSWIGHMAHQLHRIMSGSITKYLDATGIRGTEQLCASVAEYAKDIGDSIANEVYVVADIRSEIAEMRKMLYPVIIDMISSDHDTMNIMAVLAFSIMSEAKGLLDAMDAMIGLVSDRVGPYAEIDDD